MTSIPGLLARIIPVALFSAALSACASMQGYPVDPQGPQELADLQAKYFGSNSEAAYNAAPPGGARQAIRDDIVYHRMQIYNMEFSDFERALSLDGNSIAVGTDLASFALSGLAATTGNAATKAALAAASAGVLSANGAINKDLYYQSTLPALIAQMKADRATAELNILAALKQPDALYPLARADLDLQVLNNAGSLPAAIASITEKATTQKNNAEDKMAAFRSVNYVSNSSTTTLSAWVFSNGTLNNAHFAAIQGWLNSNKDTTLHDLPVAVFLQGDDPNIEAARQQIIKDLSIPAAQ